MLVLTRNVYEKILIGENIRLIVVDIRGRSVRIGIEAPEEVRIVRPDALNKARRPARPRTQSR